ncbi:hypothetical protein F383_16069 [Gossypium arboreum]|uniref:Biopterin-dependent aromatic amino acid hydroxylase family profile domain-containing protein n=1 Tax=Gossypium arboreum TaxID=29729 RepID=A0A0B0PZD4_GOSAR|nr:hypothetical protein F383_08502 [Gossypium arboreum]KHG29864.1 hypothetical protein F383_16069 [Gossypium arboreum]
MLKHVITVYYIALGWGLILFIGSVLKGFDPNLLAA